VTWGSSTGPAREALALAEENGIAARLIALRMILPAQPDRMKAALDGVRRVLVVDQSHSGQLYRYLRAHYDIPGEIRDHHRPGPLRITASEILNQIEEWAQ
jgi:2-oxoglutarate ferredoxin oxidoreductase subunit alpha